MFAKWTTRAMLYLIPISVLSTLASDAAWAVENWHVPAVCAAFWLWIGGWSALRNAAGSLQRIWDTRSRLPRRNVKPVKAERLHTGSLANQKDSRSRELGQVRGTVFLTVSALLVIWTFNGFYDAIPLLDWLAGLALGGGLWLMVGGWSLLRILAGNRNG